MAGAAPRTKVSEALALFEYEGYKDLGNFAVKSRLSRLRRDLKALLSKGSEDAYKGYAGLGTLALYECEFDLAEELFRKALGLKPNSLEANSNYGFALINAGRIDDFSKHFLYCLEQNPTSSEIFHNLIDMAVHYARFDIYQKTIEIYQGSQTEEGVAKLQARWGDLNLLQSSFEDFGILQRDYERQMIIANSALRQIFSFAKLQMHIQPIIEGGYFSTRIFIKRAKAEEISMLTDLYFSSMFDWARQEQESGGTDVFQLMMNSVVSFASHAEQKISSDLEVI